MTKILLAVMVLAIVGLASCTPGESTNAPANNSNRTAAASPALSPTSPSPTVARQDDRTFVMNTAQNGIAEVALTRMASQKAQNAEVKRLAQRLLADHTKVNNELKPIASTKNITLPTNVKPEHKEISDRLSKLTGAEFDREFLSVMVQSHEKSITAFQAEANSGTDPEIKAFATKTLPTLQEHLRMARDLRGKLQ